MPENSSRPNSPQSPLWLPESAKAVRKAVQLGTIYLEFEPDEPDYRIHDRSAMLRGAGIDPTTVTFVDLPTSGPGRNEVLIWATEQIRSGKAGVVAADVLWEPGVQMTEFESVTDALRSVAGYVLLAGCYINPEAAKRRLLVGLWPEFVRHLAEQDVLKTQVLLLAAAEGEFEPA
jgi:hypothetical protein